MRKVNEGMPNYHNNHNKGALYITFDIDFPKGEITKEDKETIRQILSKYKTLNSNDIPQDDKYKFYNGLRGY